MAAANTMLICLLALHSGMALITTSGQGNHINAVQQTTHNKLVPWPHWKHMHHNFTPLIAAHALKVGDCEQNKLNALNRLYADLQSATDNENQKLLDDDEKNVLTYLKQAMNADNEPNVDEKLEAALLKLLKPMKSGSNPFLWAGFWEGGPDDKNTFVQLDKELIHYDGYRLEQTFLGSALDTHMSNVLDCKWLALLKLWSRISKRYALTFKSYTKMGAIVYKTVNTCDVRNLFKCILFQNEMPLITKEIPENATLNVYNLQKDGTTCEGFATQAGWEQFKKNVEDRKAHFYCYDRPWLG